MAETLIEQVKMIGTASLIAALLFGLTVMGLNSHRNRRR